MKRINKSNVEIINNGDKFLITFFKRKFLIVTLNNQCDHKIEQLNGYNLSIWRLF
jgi:hypothetical protein